MSAVGRIKFRVERLKSYASWIQAAMVLDLWMRERNAWLVLGVLIAGALAVHYFDKHVVYPGEAAAALENNPEWRNLREEIKQK